MHNLRKVECARAARPTDGGHRSVGIGQVHAGPRRPVCQPARAGRRKRGKAQDCRHYVGCEAIDGVERDRARARGRPDADRQDAALVPGDLRRLLGRHPQAVRRRHRARSARLHGPGRFSFNTEGGRCESLRRPGRADDRDEFLPDVKVLCETCGGRRFNAETLSMTYRGKSIGDVLAMSVDDAVEFFAAHPRIHHALQAAAGRRARLPHARPAKPDALRRRSAAHQARHRTGALRPERLPGRESRSRNAAHSTCSTSRPSACTWRTWRS